MLVFWPIRSDLPLLLKRLWRAGITATLLLALCNVLDLYSTQDALTAFDPAILVCIYVHFLKQRKLSQLVVKTWVLVWSIDQGYKNECSTSQAMCCLLRFAWHPGGYTLADTFSHIAERFNRAAVVRSCVTLREKDRSFWVNLELREEPHRLKRSPWESEWSECLVPG